MSNATAKFVAAARAGEWKVAYDECNGLAMYDMLDALQEIGAGRLQDMRSQMAIYDVWGGPFMARIRFAMDVVTTRHVPPNTPALPVDQVQDAERFLARTTGGAAAPAKRSLLIMLFWTEAARGEFVSTRLVQRARELLKSNNTGLELDVLPFRGEIALKGEVGDGGEVAQAIELAKQAAHFAGNRLGVIFHVTTASECDPNKQKCGRLPHGSTPADAGGRPFVFINVAFPHPDNATLLHEMGHAAGVQSRDSDDDLKDLQDVMSYGSSRTKIGFNQLNKFRSSKLFFAR